MLWGTNTIVTNLHFWPLVREAQRRGAKVVVVDPIRTRTAEAADWHLQIKPASDAALALAMMHVMIRDGLVDHDYVSRHAVGYDALAERVQQYSPAQRVAHRRPAGRTRSSASPASTRRRSRRCCGR